MVQYALIVAGGKGLRMGTELPKQFLPIGGKPVLMRTLEAFYDYNAEIRIILVLPHSQQDYWRQLCREYRFSLPHAIADGGETRFHSVKNGWLWSRHLLWSVCTMGCVRSWPGK